MFSLKNVEKALGLLFFAQKGLKRIGFTMFSLKSIGKALVLLSFRSQVLKKHGFSLLFEALGSKSIEKACVSFAF